MATNKCYGLLFLVFLPRVHGEAGVFDLSGDVYPILWNTYNDYQYIFISTKPLIGIWGEQENVAE